MVSDRQLLRITCSGCELSWAGADRAHCATCHRSFDDVALFDAHRAQGRCRHPRELGLVATKNGIWLEREPGSSRQQRVRRAS